MNKQDLVNNFVQAFDEVFPNANTKDKKLGLQMINYIFDSIKSEVATGKKVNISRFGSFDIIERPTRDGRNPSTGEPIVIDKHSVVKFKPSQAFKDAVN